MSKREAIQKAVVDALQKHSDRADWGDDLRSVTVIVKMNRAQGLPRAVIVQTESEETL